MTKKHMMGFIFISLSITSFNSLAIFPKTDKDFSLLPPYCKAILKPTSNAERDSWSRRLAGIGGPHHFCAALHSYNHSQHIPRNEEGRTYKTFMLRTVLNEVAYVEGHSQNKKHALFPKIYLLKAKAYADLGKTADALIYFEKSIAANKKFVHGYLALSKYYQKIGNKQKALVIVEQGLKYKPTSKGLNRRKKELLE